VTFMAKHSDRCGSLLSRYKDQPGKLSPLFTRTNPTPAPFRKRGGGGRLKTVGKLDPGYGFPPSTDLVLIPLGKGLGAGEVVGSLSLVSVPRPPTLFGL
jgi:hypothetical protein